MSAGNVWETLEVFIRKNEKVFKLKIFCKSKHGKLENRLRHSSEKRGF